MAYGLISEFPHGNMWDGDLSELICLYDKLCKQYNYLCSEINKLNIRFANLERTMNSRIADAIKKSIEAYTAKWNSDVEMLNGKMSLLSEKMADGFSYRDTQRLEDMSRIDEELSRIELSVTNMSIELTSHIDKLYSAIKTELAAVRLSNTQDIAAAKQEFRESIAEVNNRIDDLSKDVGAVRNPFTRELSPVQKSIDDLYNLGINAGGFTALDWYNSTYITAGMFNESRITALEFYTNGRERLKMIERKDYVFSPVSGKYVKPSQAVVELAIHLGLYETTAGWFDSADITAGEYDETQLTAGQYDMESDWHQHFIQRFVEGD